MLTNTQNSPSYSSIVLEPELRGVQAGFRKGRETRDQIANINWMGIPDHLIFLLRNLHAGQEATIRTRHGTTDWLQIGKGVHQGCILSPCLFNLHAEFIKQNARLDESQVGIKIARRNIKRGETSTTLDMQMIPP